MEPGDAFVLSMPRHVVKVFWGNYTAGITGGNSGLWGDAEKDGVRGQEARMILGML